MNECKKREKEKGKEQKERRKEKNKFSQISATINMI